MQEKGALDLNTVFYYTCQILEGVSYLHEEKVIHRDIKGKNILLDPSVGIKLADFGISKQIETFSLTRGANSASQ